MAPPDFFEVLWMARMPLLNGLLVSLIISALAILFGSLLGTVVGLSLTYSGWVCRAASRGYTDFIRGTPVLVLILACFYISSGIGLDLGPATAGTLALCLFCSAHVAEMVRGAFQAIPRGQTEAAKAIGLTNLHVFWDVLAPQALRQILPVFVNIATEIVKLSTMVSIIGVADLLLKTQEIISRTFLSLEFYVLAGLVYFLINFAIERVGRHLERKIALPA